MSKEISIQEALKRKYPQAIVLVSCTSKKGKANLIPLGWSMQTSFNPLMLAISVGKTRYSHRLISETKEFVLTYPGIDMEKEIIYCGTHSGKDVDKIKQLDLKVTSSQTIKPLLIEKCLINMECKVKYHIDTGDHTIFAAEITKAYTSGKNTKKLYTVGHVKFGGF